MLVAVELVSVKLVSVMLVRDRPALVLVTDRLLVLDVVAAVSCSRRASSATARPRSSDKAPTGSRSHSLPLSFPCEAEAIGMES